MNKQIQIDDLLKDLSKARLTEEANGNATRKMLDRVRADPEYVIYTAAQAKAKEQIIELVEQVQAWAELEFKKSQNKQVHPKITLATYPTFVIKDATKLYAWVKENLAAALIVDEKEVKVYALKHPDKVDGVEVGTEQRVRIASDLS